MSPSLLLTCFLLFALGVASASPDGGALLRTYIVRVKRPSDVADSGELLRWHRSFLPAGTEEHPDRLVYSYGDFFGGFAARLTEEELEELAGKEGFIGAFPNRMLPLLTTHTPDFLGLTGPRGLWNSSNLGEGVIVGVIDSGVSPLHPSFSDDGLPPPPARWKGECKFDKGCNNKIIGARGFISTHGIGATSINSDPTDDVGHGTHTASTIAGNFVEDVNAFGFITGTAAGVAPHAHLAIYKVCQPDGCASADILAGIYAAVRDGVDVISLSIGTLLPYGQDPVTIGSFAAVEKGVTVVCAAGNRGPAPRSVSNDAPWVLTVAASTVDRSFRSTVRVRLGHRRMAYHGETLFQPANFSSKPLPLVRPSKGCSNATSGEVRGKVVLCESPDFLAAAIAIRDAGGAGIVVISGETDGYAYMAQDLPLPGSFVSYSDGEKIRQYLNSTRCPTASLTFGGALLGVSPAPVVAFFSSRGPSAQFPNILKPDVSAPGLNILAAWHVETPRSKIPFNVISGTSMATPHVSGIAALVKSLHPDWSPAAVKSAIITTSDIHDRGGDRIKDQQHRPSTYYDSGAGHVNPSRAANPGLVYEATPDDYAAYLCTVLGDKSVAIITGRCDPDCSRLRKLVPPASELNYPSITVAASPNAVTVNRTVTNVCIPTARYNVVVDVPTGVTVTVDPETLQFSLLEDKLTFSVSVASSVAAEGSISWVSGRTVVRSALIVVA